MFAETCYRLPHILACRSDKRGELDEEPLLDRGPKIVIRRSSASEQSYLKLGESCPPPAPSQTDRGTYCTCRRTLQSSTVPESGFRMRLNSLPTNEVPPSDIPAKEMSNLYHRPMYRIHPEQDARSIQRLPQVAIGGSRQVAGMGSPVLASSRQCDILST